MTNYGTLADDAGNEIPITVGSGISNENFTFEHYTIQSGTHGGTKITLGLKFKTWYGDGEPTTFDQATGAYTAVAGQYSGDSSAAAASSAYSAAGNWDFMWVVDGVPSGALRGTMEIIGPNGGSWGTDEALLAVPIISAAADNDGSKILSQGSWSPGFPFLQAPQMDPNGQALWPGLNYDFDDVGTYTFKFRLLSVEGGLDETLSISVDVEAPAEPGAEPESEPEPAPEIQATACFTEDAIVKTDQGLLKIKDITTNHTIDNKEIKGVSKTIYPQDKLVAIEKNAFGENKPNEKILVAPFHRFSIDGNLKTAVELVNNDSVYVTKYKQETLYNVILETQETMEVNNIVAETLDPNTLVAKLFDGSMENKQRRKIVKSFNSYHKNLKNKPNKTIKDYIV